MMVEGEEGPEGPVETGTTPGPDDVVGTVLAQPESKVTEMDAMMVLYVFMASPCGWSGDDFRETM